MAYEDGEIEDGEVPEDGEVREENQNGNENCEKRKATSPPHQTNGSEKRIKVEQENGAEEGECISDEGEINSPEPEAMEVDKQKAEDGELELDLSDVELFQDKHVNDIEWSAILPAAALSSSDRPRSFSPTSILRAASVEKHAPYLVRNEKLRASLDELFRDSNMTDESSATPKNLSSGQCNIGKVISENRARLGLTPEVPLRPFLPPTRFNGALANEITQFILDGTQT